MPKRGLLGLFAARRPTGPLPWPRRGGRRRRTGEVGPPERVWRPTSWGCPAVAPRLRARRDPLRVPAGRGPGLPSGAHNRWSAARDALAPLAPCPTRPAGARELL